MKILIPTFIFSHWYFRSKIKTYPVLESAILNNLNLCLFGLFLIRWVSALLPVNIYIILSTYNALIDRIRIFWDIAWTYSMKGTIFQTICRVYFSIESLEFSKFSSSTSFTSAEFSSHEKCKPCSSTIFSLYASLSLT